MERSKEAKVLTAAEARALADGAEVLIARIGKCIKDCAKEGTTKFSYSAYNASEAAVGKAVMALRGAGYSVTVSNEREAGRAGMQDIETVLTIAW